MAKIEKAVKDLKPAKPVSKALPRFDLDNAQLPEWIELGALASGGYPYDKKLKREPFEEELKALQIELVKLQTHVQKNGLRIVALFEGRDAAGKGGTIKRIVDPLNPRYCRVVALPQPTERERTCARRPSSNA